MNTAFDAADGISYTSPLEHTNTCFVREHADGAKVISQTSVANVHRLMKLANIVQNNLQGVRGDC